MIDWVNAERDANCVNMQVSLIEWHNSAVPTVEATKVVASVKIYTA